MKFLLWSIGAISSFNFSQRGMEMREVTKVATTMASEASNFIALVARWYRTIHLWFICQFHNLLLTQGLTLELH